jgi:hypothetical protein
MTVPNKVMEGLAREAFIRPYWFVSARQMTSFVGEVVRHARAAGRSVVLRDPHANNAVEEWMKGRLPFESVVITDVDHHLDAGLRIGARIVAIGPVVGAASRRVLHVGTWAAIVDDGLWAGNGRTMSRYHET